MLRGLYLVHHPHFRLAIQKRFSLSANINTASRHIHSTQSPPNPLQTNRPLERLLRFKIRKSRTPNDPSSKEFDFQDSNIETSDLELCLSDSEPPIVTNLTWLRDSCHCKQCTHEYSRQRLFTIKDFRLKQFSISEIQLMTSPSDGKWNHLVQSRNQSQDNDDYLSIRWSDGHQSFYSIAWLRYVCSLYPSSQLEYRDKASYYSFPQDNLYSSDEIKTKRPIYWNVAKINAELEPVDYRALTDGASCYHRQQESTYINANKVEDMSEQRFKAVLSLTRQLVTYGLAKVYNVPQKRDQVLEVARSLAYERPTGYGTVFDVVVEPSEDINLAYTAQEFDLHTDLPYRIPSPGVQLLHCIRNSMEGGSSYFSDAFCAAESLRETDPKLFEVLVQFPATFVVRDPYRNVNLRHHTPVISLDYQGNLRDVYYSPFMLPPVGHHQDLKVFYLAMDKLTKLVQDKENKMVVKMEPGELFIFHNRRVLHGRSAYDASKSRRWLQGCYMDIDEIMSLHEKLLDHPKETP